MGEKREWWFTKAEMAAMFGISERYFDREIRPLAPRDALRREGRCMMFLAFKILHVWRDNAIADALTDCTKDGIMVGASTPALEDLRRARAELAKLDLEERRHSLLPREGIRTAFGRVASILRAAGDTLLHRFGEEAAEILSDAIDDADGEMKQVAGAAETHDLTETQ